MQLRQRVQFLPKTGLSPCREILETGHRFTQRPQRVQDLSTRIFFPKERAPTCSKEGMREGALAVKNIVDHIGDFIGENLQQLGAENALCSDDPV